MSEPAEVIAGRAMLADFQNEAHEFTTSTRTAVDWMAWAMRLSQHLQALLDALDRAEPLPAAVARDTVAVAADGSAWLSQGEVHVARLALADAAAFTDPAMATRYSQLARQLRGGR